MMHFYVSAYKNLPVIWKKTMKWKRRVIKVDNWSKVMHKEKCEDNKLMK